MNIVKSSIEAVSGMTVSDDKRNELRRHVLTRGDIVFGRRGEMGRAGLVEERHAGWLCGTGSLRLRITGERILPEYLKHVLGTAPARAYFELASVGSTMDNLNSEIVLAFPCIVPPLDAQHEIVWQVASLDESIRGLRDPIVRQIALLRERRQALITAAVTGELEVAGVAA
jgi:type I restriction enzyme S subunit